MKIISFIFGTIISYFIINFIIKTKKHGYNSNHVKKILISEGSIKYRYIPVTYTCIYDISHN
jgi:hypothetical protein